MRLVLLPAWLAAVALGVLVLVIAPGAERLPSGGLAVAFIGVALAWGFVGVGSYVALRRPDTRTGILMVTVGLVTLVAGLQFGDAALLFALGALADVLVLAVFLHLLLAFPSGRLGSPAAAVVVGAGYVAATVLHVPQLLFGLEYNCAGADCPRNLLRIASEPDVAAVFATAETVVLLAATVAAVALVVQRWRAATAAQRRGLEPVLVLGAAIVALGAVAAVTEAAGAGEGVRRVAQLGFLSAFALLPAALLAGLVRSRFLRTAAVGRLIDRLAGHPGARRVRDALSEALGDPSLAIAYWLPDRGAHVDLDGRAVALPAPGAGRVATEIGHRGRRVGALVHDRAVCATPGLLQDAAGAAGLALENARLEVELRAQLEALRASRARLVEASDAERRRLTRDLHDGAQQRLVSLLMSLQHARARWSADPDGARAAVDAALADAGAAVEELRELAAGIHPAVLSQRGLDAALESLATRAPVPVEYRGELGRRLPAAIETAAYFVVAEALANVAKHAGATHARVEAREHGAALVVEVRDDGAGGADPAGGSGLRGLEDRVGALGGRLAVESPPRGGTRLVARLPLPQERR